MRRVASGWRKILPNTGPNNGQLEDLIPVFEHYCQGQGCENCANNDVVPTFADAHNYLLVEICAKRQISFERVDLQHTGEDGRGREGYE